MEFLAILVCAVYVSAVAIEPRHHQGRGGKKGGSQTSAVAATTVTAAATVNNANNNAAVASGSTQVLKEVGGVPGNECLTFRNNGMCRHRHAFHDCQFTNGRQKAK
ncbi:putative Ricin B lectin domain-containing protein [Seiridium cardinale]